MIEAYHTIVGVALALFTGRKSQLSEYTYVFYFIGVYYTKLISTKSWISLHLTDVIKHSQFSSDWYRSFGSGEVQRLPPHIETVTSLALDTCNPAGLACN